MTPYTPAAIAHIRQCASHLPASKIADDLGWDLATLRERARRHGIELVNPNPTMPVKTEASGPKEPQGPKPPPPFVKPGDPTLCEIIASLPQRQADILTLLAHGVPAGEFVTAKQIAAELQLVVIPKAVNDSVMRVARRLDKTARYRLETKRFRGGGHRLIDLEAKP
jgi:DNA-binding NarL/FixJ family response regulator